MRLYGAGCGSIRNKQLSVHDRGEWGLKLISYTAVPNCGCINSSCLSVCFFVCLGPLLSFLHSQRDSFAVLS